MGKLKSGYSQKTKDNLLTGAGAYFKNFTVGTDTYESAKTSGKLLGATRGGGSFKAVATVRQIEVDGAPTRTVGLETIDEWETSMSMNLLETTKDTLQLPLGAASIEDGEDHYVIKGKSNVENEDYIENITYVGTISGTNEPVIIQVYNALSTDGLDLQTASKSEAVLGVTVYGHYDVDDLETPPYAIYYPKE